MWNYEKRLQYPVKITKTNPKIAQIILTQYGGPDGELGASMRYLSQRYTMPYKEVTGILTDIGTEERAQKTLSLIFSSYYNVELYAILHTFSRHNYAAIQPLGILIQMSLPFLRTSLQVTRVPFLSLPLSCACCCALLDNSA